jgi:ribosomal protein L11 methyltransferase
MPFLQLTLTLGAADPEPFEHALLAAGALSITLQDAADDPVLEPLPGTTPLWPSVRLQALFDSATDRQRLEGELRADFGATLPELRFETLADRAWEREWLKDFRPMRFGERLWICPGGQRPPDLLPLARHSSPVTSCVIELDPGLAFGTGTHATTALCLEWLDGYDLTGARVIDYGCGSGVLAIAALKLGAREAVAIDIDPQALIATRENAVRNGVAERLTVQAVDAPLPQAAQVVLANILAEPLETLAATLAGLVAADGSLVMSGLLPQQAERVSDCYLRWFDMAPPTTRDGWARITGVRRAGG